MKDKTYSKYTIGKVARLLDISTEAIRFYESKGIVQPLRDEETGYRYFTTWDLHMLLRARHYRQYGFSLEQTAQLLREGDLLEQAKMIRKQEEEEQKQIIWHMNVLRRIRESTEHLENAYENIGVYSLRESTGIYRVNTQVRYTLPSGSKELECIKEWSQFAPFTFSNAVFRKENIEKDDIAFDFGLAVDEEYAELLNIKESNQVEYIPPAMCVHTCFISHDRVYLNHHVLEDAFSFMKQNGLKLSGDIVTRVVSMWKPDQEYFNCHSVWIPIENTLK